MAPQDTWLTVGAYFKVWPGQLEAFEQLSDQFVEVTIKESGIRTYGWSFDGQEAHCRHGYQDAEGLLEHFANAGHLFQAAIKMSDCSMLSICGPAEELAKLRGPLEGFPVQFFVLRNSFRR